MPGGKSKMMGIVEVTIKSIITLQTFPT